MCSTARSSVPLKNGSGAYVDKSAPPFQFMIDESTWPPRWAPKSPSWNSKSTTWSSVSVIDQFKSTWILSSTSVVVGTNESPQSAAFEWHVADENDPGPQRRVYFYEYPFFAKENRGASGHSIQYPDLLRIYYTPMLQCQPTRTLPLSLANTLWLSIFQSATDHRFRAVGEWGRWLSSNYRGQIALEKSGLTWWH